MRRNIADALAFVLADIVRLLSRDSDEAVERSTQVDAWRLVELVEDRTGWRGTEAADVWSAMPRAWTLAVGSLVKAGVVREGDTSLGWDDNGHEGDDRTYLFGYIYP